MKIKHLIIMEIIFFVAFMGFSSTNAVKEAIKGVCKKIASYLYNPSTSSDENFTSFVCTGPNEPFKGCEKIRNAKTIDDNKDGRNCLRISYGKFITRLQQNSSAYPKMPSKETPFYVYNEVVQNAKTPKEIKEQAQIAFITVLQKMKLSDKFSGLISETILDLCSDLNENQACTEYQKGKMFLRTQLEVLYILYLSKKTRVGRDKYHFVKLCGEFSRGNHEIEGIPPFICYGADKPFSGCEKIRDAKEIDDEKDENIPMVDSDDPTKEPFKGRNCLELSYRAFVSSLQQKTPVILRKRLAKETPLYTYDLLTQNVKSKTHLNLNFGTIILITTSAPGEIKEQVQMAFSTIVKDMKLGDNYAGFICETITDLCSALNRDQACTEYQKEKMLIRTQIEAVYQVYSQIDNVYCKELYFTHHCGEFSMFIKTYDTSLEITDQEEIISDDEDEIPSQISPFKCKGSDNPFVGCRKIKKAKKIDDEREENLPMDTSEDLTKEPFKGRNCLTFGYRLFFLGLQNKSEAVMDMESEKRPYYIFSINVENASTPQEIKQEAQRMFSFILKKELRTNFSDTICGTILNLCKDLQKEDACVNYQQSKMLLRTQLEILYFVYASLRKGECQREYFLNICGPVSAYTNKVYPQIPDPW